MPRQLAIIGSGKMGKAVAALAPEMGWDVAVALDARSNARGAGITRDTLGGAEVAIEFTEPAAAPANIRACLAAGCPVVVGTTGWYAELPAIRAEVERAGGSLLWAPNFAIGVSVFAELVRYAGTLLANVEGFDAHITETHHAAKKDAPSGTASLLRDNIGPALGRDVPVTSIRTGSVPGTHEVVLDAPFEQIVLRHEARDRRVFAAGALTAAKWLVGKRGVFTMSDILAGDES
ncbi:MAG TPA: dihydrodipicolinate reductase C-terminal domain-containing protein [Gemmatimonadaceae bacterium]